MIRMTGAQSPALLTASISFAIVTTLVLRQKRLLTRSNSFSKDDSGAQTKNQQSIGFLFDLDGTLIDFEGVAHVALSVPIQHLGKHVDWKLHGLICGQPVKTWSKQVLDALNITEMSPEEYAHQWHEETLKSFPTMKLMPGALDLVQRCRKRYPMAKLALATSSERHNFDAKIKFHPDLLKLFDAIVTGDEIERGKPNPDIFIEAARRINVDPRNCAVFEDSPSGALGGKRAGSLVIAVPDDRMDVKPDVFSFVDFRLHSLLQVDDPFLDSLVQLLQRQ